MLSKTQSRLLFLILLPTFLLAPFALHYISSETPSKPWHSHIPLHLSMCNRTLKATEIHSINLLGPNFTVSDSTNWEDRILCPGDIIGDLNDTYLTVKNCSLAMYYQDKLLWSSRSNERASRVPTKYQDICAISVQPSGNIVLYKEGTLIFGSGEESKRFLILWESQTSFDPLNTELRLQNQQLQIIQTFEEETQRLFYLDENNKDFVEDLGEPQKIADKSVTKSFKDQDTAILRRNEYIGDLNGTHLIFQANCELQLRNKNKTIWSFAPSFNYKMKCSFNVQGSDIGISKYSYVENSIISSEYYGKILQSQILLEEDRLLIIQTLEDGNKLKFCSEPGQNTELKIEKEPRQITNNDFTVPFSTFFGNHELSSSIYL